MLRSLLPCVVFVIGALGLDATAAAEPFFSPEKAQRLERLIQERMASQGVPGVSVVVLDAGRVVYQRGFGQASGIGQTPVVPMQVSTPSALGSLSKSFTAAAVLQLVEEGRVGLDDPVATHLVELVQPRDLRIGEITIRQLLNHTSGFPTYDGNFGQADYAGGADALVLAAMRLNRATLRDDPGASFEYSNGNYQLLGLLLERLDLQPFEQVVQRRVLDRLGMQHSFVRSSPGSPLVAATGHRFWLDQPRAFHEPTPRAIVAQGGVYASAGDVALYLQDLMAPAPRLLKATTRDLLFEAVPHDATSGYGLGWFVEPHGSGALVWHSGMNPGYEVEAGFSPSTGSGYVVLTNANSGFVGGSVRSLIDGTKQLLLSGRVPEDVTASAGWWVFGTLLLIALLLLWLTLLWAKRLASGLPRAWKPLAGGADFLRRLWLPLLAFWVLAALLLWYIPKASGIPLPGLLAFAPDVGLMLLLGGSLALLLGGLRTLTLLLRGR